MRILVVEDDLNLREAIVDTLKLNNFDVVEAAHGIEGLHAVRTKQLDLVLTDINMPGMDGIELLQHIKQEFPWLPVILMTAYGDVSQAVKAMQLGANDYLMKPFELKELEDILAPFSQHAVVPDSNEPICEAPASKQLFQMAQRVAQTDSTVLISGRSEEHTSELQSRPHLVCRLLLEKKKKNKRSKKHKDLHRYKTHLLLLVHYVNTESVLYSLYSSDDRYT